MDDYAGQGGYHVSTLANKFDPRIHNSHDQRETKAPVSDVPDHTSNSGGLEKPYHGDTMADGMVGAHDSEVAEGVERGVPDGEYQEEGSIKIFYQLSRIGWWDIDCDTCAMGALCRD